MGLIPEQSFTVRKPAWWDNAREYTLAEYPGRELAMLEAGHAWDVIELDSFTGATLAQCELLGLTPNMANGFIRKDDGFKSHVRSDTLALLHKCKDSYERIPNAVAYDIAELLLDEGFLYESGGSLDGGKECYLTLLLNEPITITGDTSATLPYCGMSWAHDGSASLKLRSTSVRQECQNTVAASEAEGEKLGTNFTFRHTKNVSERIAEAREAMKGIRQDFDVYRKVMEELALIPLSPEQRDLFVSTIIGDRDGIVSKSEATSPRVKNNIEAERAKINALFFGPTIPEAHLLTGYGAHLAAVEYFDHLRRFKSRDSYVRRTLLADNPAKASLVRTIKEVVAA